MHRVHLIISGDVVGVGYRAWVQRWAQDKPLTGWVKNRPDRTVELVAEGPRQELEELVKQCQPFGKTQGKHGPDVACLAKRDPPPGEVERVDVRWEKGTGEFTGFEVVY